MGFEYFRQEKGDRVVPISQILPRDRKGTCTGGHGKNADVRTLATIGFALSNMTVPGHMEHRFLNAQAFTRRHRATALSFNPCDGSVQPFRNHSHVVHIGMQQRLGILHPSDMPLPEQKVATL